MLDVLFSDEDSDLYDVVWYRHAAGYAFNNRQSLRYAHRVVLQRKLNRELKSTDITDHINRNKLDNRRENIRLADKSVNTMNRDIRPDNTSGFTGVYKKWSKKHQLNGWSPSYYFIIQRKGHKTFNSKYYKTPEEAHRAREEKLKEY